MKDYPSIPKTLKRDGETLFIFDKLDGSNLRFEWSAKRGWYKYGTRNHLFDETDECFGVAIPKFHEMLAEPIDKIARANKWDSLVVFAEFWGEGSFAGKHKPEETKTLSLFDAAIYKKGILGPDDFLKTFGDLPIAKFLGKHAWTPEFVESIRTGEFPGISFEGVIGKGGTGHELRMVKAKTQAWMDKVSTVYTPEQATALLRS